MVPLEDCLGDKGEAREVLGDWFFRGTSHYADNFRGVAAALRDYKRIQQHGQLLAIVRYVAGHQVLRVLLTDQETGENMFSEEWMEGSGVLSRGFGGSGAGFGGEGAGFPEGFEGKMDFVRQMLGRFNDQFEGRGRED